ncbi:phospholipase-like protein [Tanacetum coccineum]
MDLTGLRGTRVPVIFSIPFGREEFCLVTWLRFGVQNWAEYDTKERIPFRRRVFPSYLDGQPITGIDIANLILDESFAQLYDDDAVGLCCLGILQLVILGVESKRVVPDWMLRLANDRVAWDKYPWGSYVVAKLEEMNVQSVRQENKEPIIADQHYGLSDFTQFQSTQGGPSSFQGHVNSSYFNMGTPPIFKNPIASPNMVIWKKGNVSSSRVYADSINGINLPTAILPKQCVNKTKNKGKKANLSLLNLGGAFENDNVEENNVTFLGSQFTGSFLMYENVDPTKKFKLEANECVNLIGYALSFDYIVDITDDDEVQFFVGCACNSDDEFAHLFVSEQKNNQKKYVL